MRGYPLYLLGRLGQFVLVVFIGINISFIVTHSTPIDPVEQTIAAATQFGSTSPEAIAMMRQIADITGTMDRARPIIEDAQQALNAANAANEKRQPLRTFCPIWRRPWMTVGPNTYVHDFLLACGAINIFADRHDRYPRADLDEVARRIPEVILLPSDPYPFGPKHLREFTQYAHIPAVRDNRIYLVDGKHVCWYGPRIGPGLRFVQGILWEGDSQPAAPSP